MRFRLTAFSLCLVLAALSLTTCSQPEPAAVSRPNIVFILLDDVRWDDLGAGGHPFVQTPNFDRVAHEGALFTNAFATTPLCSPNRATILTGQYAHTHGIIDNVDRTELSHKLMTFPRHLHDAGYETAFIGKWHMGVDDSPRPGIDYWYSLQGQGYHFDPEVNENGVRKKVEGYTTDIFGERAVEFVRKSRDRPFMLYLSHKVVHPNLFQNADSSTRGPVGGAEHYTPAPRHAKLYEGKTIPRRPNTASYGKDKPALQRPIPGVVPLGPESGTDDATILNRLRMLSSADEGMGELYKTLEETGQLDNTVIIFTSDHGFFYGEHGLQRERRLAYEETIRVPLYIRYPSMITAGTHIDDFVLSVDYAPTILGFAGLDTPADMHGRSAVPLLKGEQPADWRKSFLVEYYSDTVMPRIVKMGYKAVRTDKWKYIHYVDLEGMDEIYNLESDPYEMKNLISDEAAQAEVAAMKAELDRLLEETAPVTY